MLETASSTNRTPGHKPGMLSPEQIQKIQSLWDSKTIREIAGEVGAPEDMVRAFAKTHYLYFKYLR